MESRMLMDTEYEHIRMDFGRKGKVVIRRRIEDDGKAVIYTDIPSLKAQLRDMETYVPENVSVLVDDPEAEERPETDSGLIQAAVRATEGFEPCILTVPSSGDIFVMWASPFDSIEETDESEC